MVKITQPDFWSDFSHLNDPTYRGDGVDRQRYKFDEDGFQKGTDAATLQARQLLQERIKTTHQDLVDIIHPVDYDVTVGGTPIDKVKFDT